MSIPRGATRRPVAVWMLLGAIVLLGGISFSRLPIDLLPDVSYPRLVVYTSYEEVAPAEVERRITEVVEAAAAAVPGVERITSVSRYGVSLVTLRFAWGTDMDFAMLNVRERIDNARDALPETVARPTILRVDPNAEPILTLSVSGGEDLWRTKEIAETVLRRRLEQLEGVAQAAVAGGLDREIQVEVDPDLIEAYGVSIESIADALDRANVSAPGGTILQGRYRYPLRTLGEFQAVSELRDVVVASEITAGGTRVVRLADLAQVIDGFQERETIARFDGREAVGVLVFKEAGANTVAVSRLVRATVEDLEREFPAFEIEVAEDQAGFIADSISNVVQALVFGGLLAFLVLFLFLRDPRYPVAIALAIPVSVVGTFALMEAAGVSLNIMSLGGLALGVGMLVDNSIVVLENIFRHREEEGSAGAEGAARGAEEVQSAITASTLTTISVFGPIVYVEGVAGELFRDLSLAVTFSLLASLLVALTLLPMLAARFGVSSDALARGEVNEVVDDGGAGTTRGGPLIRVLFAPFRWLWALAAGVFAELGAIVGAVAAALGRTTAPVLDAFDRLFEAFAARYHAALEGALDRPGRVLASAATILAVSLAVALTLPRDLLPDVDQGALTVRLEMPEGTALDATDEVAGYIEGAIVALPEVTAVFSTVGRDVREYATGEEASGLHTARLSVRLREGAEGEGVAARIRSLVGGLPVGVVSVESGGGTALGAVLGGSEADVSVRVRGDDLDPVLGVAEIVAERMRSVSSLANVRIGTVSGQPQVQIEIDRAACARYGIDPLSVARTVDDAMRGAVATQFVSFDRKIDVVVRYPESLRYARETLEGLRVGGIPLRELTTIRDAIGPVEVRREAQGRVVPVYADVTQGGLDVAVVDIDAALAGLEPAADVRWDVGGENEEMRRSFRDLGFAFALALILVYMILAAQFESFVQPLTILVSVPLALVGVVAALLAAGQGLNTMSLIGVVILVGIVVNDAIVKVDFIQQMRASGLEVRAAILEAGRVRLRPILMTTVTTILGLTPMALGVGRGADLRAPLAIAVIGGLGVATVLTLLVVPVVYQVIEGIRSNLLRQTR